MCTYVEANASLAVLLIFLCISGRVLQIDPAMHDPLIPRQSMVFELRASLPAGNVQTKFAEDKEGRKAPEIIDT
jgi:hypothetical protein